MSVISHAKFHFDIEILIVGENFNDAVPLDIVSTICVINGAQNVGPRESRVNNCSLPVSAREREKRDR